MGERAGQLPFQAHVELLQRFLAHRAEIIDRIQVLLNAQRKPPHYLQDGPLLSRHFEDCFFSPPTVTPEQARLRGELQEAHWASGFKPRESSGMHNDLVDPGEMMVRGFHLWQRTRWPGRNGRARYAHTLFDLYLLRRLAHLVMRLWDAGSSIAVDRLSQVQEVLDQLWRSTPADQPVIVRDARWLIPLAQSPTTDDLAPYFAVAERIAESLSEPERLEIHKASAVTAGGHLRSQLRHYCLERRVSLDDHGLVLDSRKSNALDFALLIQNLVPLLDAYERAAHGGDDRRRLELAGAICQGISADPEMFVNRIDLLGAYSMIEHLFIETDRDGQAVYTATGQRHVRLLREYAERIGRLSGPLYEDCPRFRPIEGAYSPYGVIFGFSSNLTEHMALKTLQPDTVTRFSVEDVFVEGDASAERLAWVNGWRKLPHIDPEVQRMFDYPQQFATDIFDRIEHALRTRVSSAANDVDRTGRLFVLSGEDSQAHAAQLPPLPIEYVGSSDTQRVAAGEAHFYDPARLLHDRREGMFVVSYETSGGWVAITKDILTEFLGAGRDASIAGLPAAAAGVLKLMCPDLVVPPGNDAPGARR